MIQGRRPSRPDAQFYRQARKSGLGRRGRRRAALEIAAIVMGIAGLAVLWVWLIG